MREKGKRIVWLLALLAALLGLSGCTYAQPDPTPTPVPVIELPDGLQAPENAESLDLSALPAEETEAALARLESFPVLRELVLGGEDGGFTLEQIGRLEDEHPEWRLRYTLNLAGQEVELESESVDLSALSGAETAEVLPRLRLMPRLRRVALGAERENGPDWEQLRALSEAAANADLDYRFTIGGREFNLNATELDLNHIPMEDEGALVRQVIACMPNLNRLVMDSCGVSNEAMASIRDDYPWVEVVWRIWFGDCYSVRTDVEKILASIPGIGGNLKSEELDRTLIYCTKLKYLDLGHNVTIRDVEFLRYMPDLEVLILAMNHLGDLSPLADCHKLEYLELFLSDISDLSPLSGLTELRHLNIGVCHMLEDLTPIYGLELERLYVGQDTGIPREQIEEYERLHPDCEVDKIAIDTSSGTWRYTHEHDEDPDYMAQEYDEPGLAPRFALLRRQFGYNGEKSDYSFTWLDPDI